jgi:hypothetical protein
MYLRKNKNEFQKDKKTAREKQRWNQKQCKI